MWKTQLWTLSPKKKADILWKKANIITPLSNLTMGLTQPLKISLATFKAHQENFWAKLLRNLLESTWFSFGVFLSDFDYRSKLGNHEFFVLVFHNHVHYSITSLVKARAIRLFIIYFLDLHVLLMTFLFFKKVVLVFDY